MILAGTPGNSSTVHFVSAPIANGLQVPGIANEPSCWTVSGYEPRTGAPKCNWIVKESAFDGLNWYSSPEIISLYTVTNGSSEQLCPVARPGDSLAQIGLVGVDRAR